MLQIWTGISEGFCAPTMADKMKKNSFTRGFKLYHQWQLYLCVSVFQWDPKRSPIEANGCECWGCEYQQLGIVFMSLDEEK